MARYLVLDWDHHQLHLVAADVRGEAVRIQRALVWSEDRVPNPAEADELGKKLRDRLKEAGIAPAPLLACIGRDRVILKDIRHPAVPAHEEPAVVRFQAVRELTDPPDEVVIDYTSVGESSSERRALALIARRELVKAYQDLAQAAGLRLAALTPRLFGIVAAMKLPAETEGAVAVLAVAERWAEFCVARGGRVLFTRSLAVGPTLPGEVRRSLAVYGGQGQHPVRGLYVAGGEEHAAFRESLQNSLGIPVLSFDPLAGVESLDLPTGARGAFAGAVGLLHLQASGAALPINFIAPKQPKPPRDHNRQRLLVGALALMLAIVGLFALGQWQLMTKDRENAVLGQKLTELERREREMQADAKTHADLQKWSNSEIVWLDELYDLSALFPDTRNIQLKQITSGEFKGAGKDKDFVGMMTLSGVQPRDNRKQAEELRSRLFQDSYYRPGPVEDANSGRLSFGRTHEFKLKVEAKKRPAGEYKREILAADLPSDKATEKEKNRKPQGNREAGGGQE